MREVSKFVAGLQYNYCKSIPSPSADRKGSVERDPVKAIEYPRIEWSQAPHAGDGHELPAGMCV